MYCRKCGKQIEYDSEFCIECKAEAAARAVYREILEKEYAATSTANTQPQTLPVQAIKTEETGKTGVMYNFGKALTSTILAFFYFIFTAIALDSGFDFGLFFFSLGFCVPAVIMGAVSMKGFFTRKKQGYAAPVPSLVLGSIAVGICAFMTNICIFS